MRPLYLKYNREEFWNKFWKESGVDPEKFVQLDIYPINVTLDYVKREKKILECGFGGGRVIRHLHAEGYDIEGIEYDGRIVYELKKCDSSLRITRGDILSLPFRDNRYDITLCYGVIGGLYEKMARAIWELKRVTKEDGIIIISVAVDNIARRFQRLLNRLSDGKDTFYCWLDSEDGWKNYFKTFDLETIESRYMVSRYNIYYWAPFLRSFFYKSNRRLARVDEREYRLNLLGELVWFIHRTFLRTNLAGAISFVLKNKK